MSVFAIADLHLPFSVPQKNMEVFGLAWNKYTQRLEEAWRNEITSDDLVLIAGDISWAKTTQEAKEDLNWLETLPGTKLLLKGNHDYWWSSLAQVKAILPPSMHLIQNNVYNWKGISIGGARLWDTQEFTYDDWVEYQDNPYATEKAPQLSAEEDEKIFSRELGRLEMSLKQLDPYAKWKIGMTHYPPVGPEKATSRSLQILQKFGVQTCVFGHVHNMKRSFPSPQNIGGIDFYLTAGDYLEFKPVQLAPPA
jgi:uncharacterized protein